MPEPAGESCKAAFGDCCEAVKKSFPPDCENFKNFFTSYTESDAAKLKEIFTCGMVINVWIGLVATILTIVLYIIGGYGFPVGAVVYVINALIVIWIAMCCLRMQHKMCWLVYTILILLTAVRTVLDALTFIGWIADDIIYLVIAILLIVNAVTWVCETWYAFKIYGTMDGGDTGSV